MKPSLIVLSAFCAALFARADIEILYLAPSDKSPVLGSVSTDSEAYRNAVPVEGKDDWMEVVRKDYYSGFIARDSLTADGVVEPGTALLMTPSPRGKVLTVIEEGDEVTINLVDDWTEITVHKEIPGYYQPTAGDAPPPGTRPLTRSTSSRVTYADDPLLARAESTRYTPPSGDSPAPRGSSPVAARSSIPTSEPLTGYEEVDSLNPSFGRTAPDGNTRGYTLGAGSTPMPQETTAGSTTFLDGSMEDPTSIARIPAPTPSRPVPTIEAPTQAETVDAMQESESDDLEEGVEEDESMEAEETPPENESQAAADAEAAGEEQDEALGEVESGELESDEVESDALTDDSDMEVIPLVPSAPTDAGATPPVEAPVEEETVEETATVIVESEGDVKVENQVAEAVVPGISQPIAEDEPPLVPPTDTNRVYIGKLQRTSSGFFGSKPLASFELVNYNGDRIAYVDIADIPMGSHEKLVDRIVRVYGTLQPTGKEGVLLIKAANVTLR